MALPMRYNRDRPGEIVRGLILIYEVLSPEEIAGQVEFV